MIFKDLDKIKNTDLKEFIKERVLMSGEKLFSRVDYFNNKTLNKYIDVYTLDCDDLKFMFYILDFKTKSNKLKEMALKSLIDYNIKRVYVYVWNENKILELGLKINGTYKNVFLGIEENKYKLTIKEVNFQDILDKYK